jgi:hypothetical protein
VLPNLVDTVTEMVSAAIGQVIAVDAGDYEVFEGKLLCELC